MKKIIFTTLSIVILILSGCASSNKVSHASLKFDSTEKLPASITPVEVISDLKPHAIKISESISAHIATKSNGAGFFELVQIAGEENEKFAISVMARCDCLGFRKRGPGVSALVIDQSGNIISSMLRSNLGTVGLHGSFSSNGPHYIVLIAEETAVGELVLRVGDSYNGFVDVSGALDGTVIVRRFQ